MGDLASDHDSAISLIIDEYRRLEKHDNTHKLLKYIFDITNEGFKYSKDKKIRNEFFDKYNPTEDNSTAGMLADYWIDLRNAVDKIEGIDRSPKLKTIEKIVETENMDELPF